MTSLQHLESPTARGQAISRPAENLGHDEGEKRCAHGGGHRALRSIARRRLGRIDGATTKPPD